MRFRRLLFVLALLISFVSGYGQLSSLEFDGVNDLVTLDKIDSTWAMSSFTLEAKVQIAVNPQTVLPTLISNRIPGDWDERVTWNFHKSSMTGYEYHMLRIEDITSVAVISNPSDFIADGSCHHIAVSRDNGNIKFYIDGQFKYAVYKSALDGVFTRLHPQNLANIGYDESFSQTYNISSNFDGVIDEIRIWNYQLSDAQIQWGVNFLPTPLPSGLTLLDFASSTNQIVNKKNYWFSNTVTTPAGYLGGTTGSDIQDPIRGIDNCFINLGLKIALNEDTEEKSLLYPNPAGQYVNVNVGTLFESANPDLYIHKVIAGDLNSVSSLEGIQLQIVNSFGVVVAEEFVNVHDSEVHLNVESLESGVYILKFSNGEVSASKTFYKS